MVQGIPNRRKRNQKVIPIRSSLKSLLISLFFNEFHRGLERFLLWMNSKTLSSILKFYLSIRFKLNLVIKKSLRFSSLSVLIYHQKYTVTKKLFNCPQKFTLQELRKIFDNKFSVGSLFLKNL